MIPTILIRVEEDGGRRPIHLFESHDRDDWLTAPVASAEVPALELPELPPLREDQAGADPIRGFLLDPQGPPQNLERIGAYLHGLLAVGDVGQRWRSRAGAGAVRVMLDVRAPRLERLPWELLFDAPKWLSTDPQRPLMRVTSGFPGAAEVLPVRWPLRVMVVVGSRKDDRVVDADQEIINLEDAFRRLSGMVDFEFLHQPSRDVIRTKYRELRPHIFHFIGHGDVADGRGRIFLHDLRDGEDKPWTPDLIDIDLAGWQPRLAILNACRTNSVEDQDGAWGVAELFQRLGALAVVAMQADIRGDAAAKFTASLYQSLARDEPLDAAVAEGRAAITRVSGVKERDFALPSLTVSAPPEDLLRMRFGVPDDYRDHVEFLRPRWAGFADRTSERRRLLPVVDPEPDEAAPANGHAPAGAIAIVGRREVGKTELARWCVAACALHGGNAAYVDLDRRGALEFRSTLEIIGEELSQIPIHGRRNGNAFERWREEMRRLALDRYGPGTPAPDALNSAFTYFQDALQSAAGGRLLLIALDHVRTVQGPDWDMISRWLLEPIAKRSLPPVRLIVVLTEDQSESLRAELRSALSANTINLKMFKPEAFKPVAAEYLRHRFDLAIGTLAERVESLQQFVGKGEFNWRQVKLLHELVQASRDWTPYS